MIDNPDGYINLLDDCPLCHGDIEPHCSTSRACDIVRCQTCGNTGSIDGRYWPKRIPASPEAYGSAVRDFVRRQLASIGLSGLFSDLDEPQPMRFDV